MNILKNLDIGCLKMALHQRLSIQNECGHQMSFPCLLHQLGYILAELTDLLKQKSHRCVHNKFVFHQNVEPEQGYHIHHSTLQKQQLRSEERRVGKECRSRWWR